MGSYVSQIRPLLVANPLALTVARPALTMALSTAKAASKNLYERILEDRLVWALACFLFSVDILLVSIHGAIRYSNYIGSQAISSHISPELWSLSHDWGYPECFNYLKLLFVLSVLMALASRSRQPVHTAWAAVFLFVLVDDACRLHEGIGRWISTVVGPLDSAWLPAQAVGETLFWGAAGVPLLVVLTWAFWRSAPAHRVLAAITGLSFMLLAVFAVIVDLIHAVSATAGAPKILDRAMEVVEDGGEMLAVSLTCTLALLMLRHFGSFATNFATNRDEVSLKKRSDLSLQPLSPCTG